MRGFIALIQKLFKRYGRSGFFLLLLQVVTVAVQLLILPFLSRTLTPAEFGIFQFSQSLINWLAAFSLGNITFGAKKGMVEQKNGTMWYAFLYRLKIMSLLSCVCFAAGLVLFLVGKPLLPLVCLVVGLFLLVGYLPQVSYPQMFMAKNQFGWSVFWQGLAIVSSQVLTVLVAFWTKNVSLVIIAQYASFAIFCIFGFVHALKKYSVLASYKNNEIDRDCIPYGKKLLPVEILQGTAGTLHNFIVGPLFGFATLALFSVATRIDVLLRSVVASGYYLLYTDFVKTDYDTLKQHIKKNSFFIFLSSFLLSVGLFFVSVVYIQKFLPPFYHSAILYTGILICGLPALMLQSIIQAALESKLKADAVKKATYVSQLLRIVLLVIGGMFGVVGITVSLTVSAWFSVLCFVLVFFEPPFIKKFLPLK